MALRTIAVAALLLAGSASACASPGSDDPQGGASAVATVAVAPAPTIDMRDTHGGGLGEAVEIAAGAPDAAAAGVCDIELRTIQTATELYLAIVGEPPTSQDDLLDQQLIVEASPHYVITADGTIAPAPDGPCT